MTIAAAALATTVIGTGMSVAGGLASAKTQSKYADAQAAMLRQQAEEEARVHRIQAAQEEVERTRLERAEASQNRAMAAAAGLDLGASRSFLALQEANASAADKDIANIRLNASLRRRRTMFEMNEIEMQRKAGKAQAASTRWGAIASGVKGAGSALSTGAQMFGGGSLANTNTNFQGTYGGAKVSYMPNSGSKW